MDCSYRSLNLLWLSINGSQKILMNLLWRLVVSVYSIPYKPKFVLDFIILKDHYYDGWGYGMNLRTSHEGVFPLQATIPRIGPYVKFTIINCCNSSEDVYGLETLNGVEIAYPNNIEIHHLLTNPRVLVDRNLGGGNTTIHDGVRLNQQILEKIITPTWDLNRPNSQVAVVSGPTLFNSMVVDSLMEIGAENGEIRVLDADRFIEY